MTRSDIIDIANDMAFLASIWIDDDSDELNDVIKFAKLVEAKASAKEREACAETCLQVVASQEMKKFMGDAAHYAACTAAIRARGEA